MAAAAPRQAAVDVTIRGLSHAFERSGDPVAALGPLDLEVAASETLGIIGPARCGKTTLVRSVAGLVAPTAGEVRIAGVRVACPSSETGVAFERPALLDWRTALGNVLLAAEPRRVEGTGARDEARRLLALMGLSDSEDRKASELGHVDRVRVGLCRALIGGPRLLLVDDVFAGLNAIAREALALDLQRARLERRPTTLLATQSIAEAVVLSDRVVVLTPAPGRIAFETAIDLPRPRRFDRATTPRLVEYCNRIRTACQASGGEWQAPGSIEP
jgi:NitT/TauT family transport system ATP-binding protein